MMVCDVSRERSNVFPLFHFCQQHHARTTISILTTSRLSTHTLVSSQKLPSFFLLRNKQEKHIIMNFVSKLFGKSTAAASPKMNLPALGKGQSTSTLHSNQFTHCLLTYITWHPCVIIFVHVITCMCVLGVVHTGSVQCVAALPRHGQHHPG